MKVTGRSVRSSLVVMCVGVLGSLLLTPGWGQTRAAPIPLTRQSAMPPVADLRSAQQSAGPRDALWESHFQGVFARPIFDPGLVEGGSAETPFSPRRTSRRQPGRSESAMPRFCAGSRSPNSIRPIGKLVAPSQA